MIIGYQVQNTLGNNFADKPSYLILTQESAISDLKQARAKHPKDCFLMVAILDGDIEEPTFEYPIMEGIKEHYQTLVLSTAHLTKDDMNIMNSLPVNDIESNMFLVRDTGYLVKLYEDNEYNSYPAMTTTFNKVLIEAKEAGFRAVEFDRDAEEHPYFVVHE